MYSHITEFLDKLNSEYLTLHTVYENHFRKSYMGNHSQDKAYAQAQADLEAWKSNAPYRQQIIDWIKQFNPPSQNDTPFQKEAERNILNKKSTKKVSFEKEMFERQRILLERLQHWAYFFSLHQIPAPVKELKNTITAYENDLQKKQAAVKSGYTDPATGTFIETSRGKMSLMMRTHTDEKVRKACFVGIQSIATMFVKELIQLTKWKNEYARACGYTNFYEYKAKTEERMSSQEIFTIFDTLYEQLSPNFAHIQKLEQDSMPGLRKPRNFGYMMAGDFTKQEDPYFPLETIIDSWGKSYTALGIDYQGAKMELDLLERKGKYDNGFCHQPIPTYFMQGKKQAGQTNFTCNALYGQVGAGNITGATLFHEGGHAAHFANMNQADIILNTEYPPQSTARAETQSMFLDTMFSSIERKMRYAKSLDGKSYPFGLYEKKVKKLHKISGNGMLSIAAVVKFEERLFGASDEELTEDFVLQLAQDVAEKYFDYSEPTLWILTVPHIYSRNSSAYYHGYGMAQLGLSQIRKHFYDTDGYIVDNPHIGKVLSKGRNLGSSKNYNELLQTIIGADLSPDAFIASVMKTEDQVINTAKQRLTRLASVPTFAGPVTLNAKIFLVDGPEEISNNVEMSWEQMNEKWGEYITAKEKG